MLQSSDDMLETRVRSIQDKLNSGSAKKQTPVRSQLKPKEIGRKGSSGRGNKESMMAQTQQFKTQEKFNSQGDLV